MEAIKSKKVNLIQILSLILGMIVCNNVIYAFKVGRTYINISYVYGVVLIVIFAIIKRKELKTAIKEMSIYFKLFILVALISVVPATFAFIENLSKLTSYLNGIIDMGLCVILYIDILVLKEHKSTIIKGIAIGFVFNILLSLVQYITYNNGNYFSLYYLFPQPAFQINSYYGANTILQQTQDTFNIYAYRAQGFFLETSYYMAFLAGTAIVLFVTSKKGLIKILSIISMIFIIATTSSGNMIIILFAFILYFIMKKIKSQKEDKVKKISKKDFIYMFITATIIIMVAILNYSKIETVIEENNVYEKIVNNINSANIASEDNAERFTNMIMSLKLVPKYPLGAGYNMSPTLLDLEYEDGILRNNATYNRLISIQLEMGILGTIIYLAYIYQISVKLILKSKQKYTLAIGIAALAVFICQVGNGIGFYPFVIMIFALANIEYSELKKNKKIEEKLNINC